MSRSLDQLLARAVQASRPPAYTAQELAAAEARIAARIADRVAARPGPAGEGRDEAEVFQYLAILCRTVVEQEGAFQHMAGFLGGRVPQPEGARVLGCVLQLAGREDSARFWWQFAAGAGDGAAAYCLYLHHMTLGETWEAELWHRQAGPGGSLPPGTGTGDGTGAGADADEDEAPVDGSNPALVLRVLTLLYGDRTYLTAAAEAVVHYVPDAVRFVDELELPLPDHDFARRIGEMTEAG
jgi:hypothetical protein